MMIYVQRIGNGRDILLISISLRTLSTAVYRYILAISNILILEFYSKSGFIL